MRRHNPHTKTRRARRARSVLGSLLHAPRGLRNESGMTMVEVLVSLVVLAILIVPISDALVAGRVFTSHRGEHRMAMRLVERKLEQLMAAGYGSTGPDDNILSTNLDPGSHPITPDIVVNTMGDDCDSNDVLGELTWNVAVDSYSTPGDSVHRKIVDVKLVWPQGAPRDSILMSTVISAG